MNNIFCACGILLDRNDKTLLLSRDHKEYLKSYYEFPGGKVKNGENFYSAIARELNEELSINVNNKQISPFKLIQYKYSKFNLIMHSFIIKKWSGNLISLENVNLNWVDIKSLSKANLLPGNKELVRLLKNF